MRIHRAAIAAVWIGAWSPAAAADCPTPYTIDALLADLVEVEAALRTGDDEAARVSALDMRAGLGCLSEVLPRLIVGRAYRAVGAGLFASGNLDGGTEWFITATEVEQSFDYGLEDLPADHPIRVAYADARALADGEEVVIEGSAFAMDSVKVDGRSLDAPRARLNRPHLVQWGDTEIMSAVIDGNDFPSAVLADAAAVADAGGKPKKEKTAKAPKADKPEKVAKAPREASEKPPKRTAKSGGEANASTMVATRERPWEKTPLMIGGAAIMGGAAALYYVSFNQRGVFDESNDLDQISDLQGQVNRLVIASAAVFAVGAGTMAWGVILDGSGQPLPAVRVRF